MGIPILKNNNLDQQILYSSISNEKVHSDHMNNGQNSINNKIFKFMKKPLIRVFLAFFLVMIFIACQEDYTTEQSKEDISKTSLFGEKMSPQEIDHILKQPITVTDPEMLNELQFMKDQDMITPQFYEVLLRTLNNNTTDYPGCKDYFCDVVYGREGIQNRMKEKVSSGENISARHRRDLFMYNSSGGTITLRVKISATPGVSSSVAVPTEWLTAINEAVKEWNALNYNVKFNVATAANNTNPSGFINVYRGTLTIGTWAARAQFPQSSGAFGSFIQINNSYTGTALTATARKFAIAHELGHIVGMHHTDTGNGVDVYSGISCYGSSNYTDFNSVFKANMSYNEPWNGFTTCDKTVLNYYW